MAIFGSGIAIFGAHFFSAGCLRPRGCLGRRRRRRRRRRHGRVRRANTSARRPAAAGGPGDEIAPRGSLPERRGDCEGRRARRLAASGAAAAPPVPPLPRGDALEQWKLGASVHEMDALHRAGCHRVFYCFPPIRPLIHHPGASKPGFDPECRRCDERALEASDAGALVHERGVVPAAIVLGLALARPRPRGQR